MLENERKYFPCPVTIVLFGSHYSGKTTLSRLFTEKLDIIPIEEFWAKNPYVHSQEVCPLDNQIWYLLQTFEAMVQAKKLNGEGKSVVLDTFPYSTLIFSQITLTDREYAIFTNIFNSLIGSMPIPDLLIYLQASTDFLFTERRMSRIKTEKGPKTDLTVSRDWLDKSCRLHDQFFVDWDKSSKIQINIEEDDLLRSSRDFDRLMADIKKKLINC